jgi:hypothetical protein
LINHNINVEKIIKTEEVSDQVRKIYLENKPEKSRRRILLDSLNGDRPIINFVKYVKYQRGLIDEINSVFNVDKVKETDDEGEVIKKLIEARKYTDVLKNFRLIKMKKKELLKKDKKRRKGRCYKRVTMDGKIVSEDADVDAKLASMDIDLTSCIDELDLDGILD